MGPVPNPNAIARVISELVEGDLFPAETDPKMLIDPGTVMQGKTRPIPNEYIRDLPQQNQTPPYDTPHPMDELQRLLKGNPMQDADELAHNLMNQELFRDVLSKHLYQDAPFNGAPYVGNVTGEQLPSTLGRDYPIADPLNGLLEQLMDNDTPMY